MFSTKTWACLSNYRRVGEEGGDLKGRQERRGEERREMEGMEGKEGGERREKGRKQNCSLKRKDDDWLTGELKVHSHV